MFARGPCRVYPLRVEFLSLPRCILVVGLCDMGKCGKNRSQKIRLHGVETPNRCKSGRETEDKRRVKKQSKSRRSRRRLKSSVESSVIVSLRYYIFINGLNSFFIENLCFHFKVFYFYINAVKWLITINRIQNKSFCLLCIFIMCIY